jgi:hypothetical protein
MLPDEEAHSQSIRPRATYVREGLATLRPAFATREPMKPTVLKLVPGDPFNKPKFSISFGSPRAMP